MKFSKNTNPLVVTALESLVFLPRPSSLRYFWNFGSLLGLSLTLQLVTGILLAITFSGEVSISFSTVALVARDCGSSWVIRMIHANGARIFFFFIYLHIGRGVYYISYLFSHTWTVGVVIFLLTIGTAFLGYVLPWGQMSFWGASVITGLLRAVPYVGGEALAWVWGRGSVDNPVLVRFFSLHFFLPFLIRALRAIHLIYLHTTGSGNPLGLTLNCDKLNFHPYFSVKDLLGVFLVLTGLIYVVGFVPWFLGDPENFIKANPILTPIHIKPEWYFLFAYAILRSIPSKLGGVLALVFSVVILVLFVFQTGAKFRGLVYYGPLKFYFWRWVNRVFLLTWIGARPVEEPYIFTGQIFSVYYFLYYFLNFGFLVIWDNLLNKIDLS